MRRILPGIVLFGLLSASAVARSAELLVSAAASLTDALREAGQEFEQLNAGSKLPFNFPASGALRAQIEQGRAGLRGDLYRQGRQVGWIDTGAAGTGRAPVGATQVVSVQPFKGNLFVSDANSGLWVIQHQPSLAQER